MSLPGSNQYPGAWDGIPVRANDVIEFALRGITANTYRLTINGISYDGRFVEFFLDGVCSTDRTTVIVDQLVLAPFFLRSAGINIIAGTSSTGPGSVYLEGHVIRQGTGLCVNLLRGYHYSGHVPSYPGLQEGPFDGRGRILETLTADPAANTEMATQQVPTKAAWILRAIKTVLVQGITQTPLPTLKFNTSIGSPAQVPITTTAIGASSTATLTWAIGLVQSSFTAVIGDEFHTAPLPELTLLAGDNFVTVTDGIGANTNYGAFSYTVEEWIVP